jgi:hypothetical protein
VAVEAIRGPLKRVILEISTVKTFVTLEIFFNAKAPVVALASRLHF